MTIEQFKRIMDSEVGPSYASDWQVFYLLKQEYPTACEDTLINGAAHDQIWLDVDVEKLIETITEDHAKFIRSGVFFLDCDSLSTFV